MIVCTHVHVFINWFLPHLHKKQFLYIDELHNAAFLHERFSGLLDSVLELGHKVNLHKIFLLLVLGHITPIVIFSHPKVNIENTLAIFYVFNVSRQTEIYLNFHTKYQIYFCALNCCLCLYLLTFCFLWCLSRTIAMSET